jgi:hypothetical protein
MVGCEYDKDPCPLVGVTGNKEVNCQSPVLPQKKPAFNSDKSFEEKKLGNRMECGRTIFYVGWSWKTS